MEEWAADILELSEQSKLLAGIVYLIFVILEVTIAPIPGAILYAPGGAIFGTFWGGLISLTGNVLGAGIACSITRAISNRASAKSLKATDTKDSAPPKNGWFRKLLNSPAFEKLKRAIASHGGWLIFVLRLNPLTSSDLISYAAGFSNIPIWRVMLATFFGMAPLCFIQSWASKSLLTAFPNLLIPLLVLCGLYIVAAVFFIRRVNKAPVPTDDNS
jgi:uncharacterized membrane protein YdjX (TVP38/TMEM64 family)